MIQQSLWLLCWEYKKASEEARNSQRRLIAQWSEKVYKNNTTTQSQRQMDARREEHNQWTSSWLAAILFRRKTVFQIQPMFYFDLFFLLKYLVSLMAMMKESHGIINSQNCRLKLFGHLAQHFEKLLQFMKQTQLLCILS